MIHETQEAVELDLQKLLMVYLNRWWVILLSALVGGVLALYVTVAFITPKYTAGVTVYVNNVRSDQSIEYVSGSNLAAAQKLVSTYINIIRSDTVLDKVLEASDLEGVTAAGIRSMMSASQVGDTEMFKVNITHPDPAAAAQIANAIAVVAPAEIESFVEGSSTKIIDYAKVPTTPSSPNVSRNCILGILIGLALALGFFTIQFLLDVRIKEVEDLTAIFDLPILAQIPAFIPEGSKQKVYKKYGAYEDDEKDKKKGGEKK